MKKGYSISGGSTKIAALAGSSIYTLRDYGYEPDYICGVSAGGILAVPLALGMYDELEELILNLTYDQIFNINPVNKKGKISLRSILRVITGKQSLGVQDNLVDTMAKLISPTIFKHYKVNEKLAPCFLGVVDYKTGSRTYLNMKNVDYDTFLQSVKATSSMPIFVESVPMGLSCYYDGGVRNSIGSHWLMENYPMGEHISVYSRPENYDITEKDWEPTNGIKVLQRTIDIMMVEISKNDEMKEDFWANAKTIHNRKIFMPYILSDQTYELSPEKLKEWFDIGYKQAKTVLETTV